MHWIEIYYMTDNLLYNPGVLYPEHEKNVYYIQLADENIWKSVNLWNGLQVLQHWKCLVSFHILSSIYKWTHMGSYGGFLSHRGIPKTMGFNTKMVVHDLDDLGYPHDFGNLHIKRLLMLQVHHCHSATRSYFSRWFQTAWLVYCRQ